MAQYPARQRPALPLVRLLMLGGGLWLGLQAYRSYRHRDPYRTATPGPDLMAA